MKKIICILTIFCLVACSNLSEEKIEVVAPTSEELGNVCSLVTEFDNDVYNISFFYTENETYPILNEDDFNYINQLGLKYSGDGSKNVKKYKINQEKALELCGIENPKVIQVAIHIPDSNILKFMNELRNTSIYYEVEKEGETFKVEMANNVISTTSLELNYTQVKSLDFTKTELSNLENIKILDQQNISLDPNYEINVIVDVGDLIQKDGTQVLNQDNKLVGLGEGYQIFLTIAPKNALSVSYVPIMTLVKMNKEDINEQTYILMNSKHLYTHELNDYILYETSEIIIYDFNTYFYEEDLKELIINHTIIDSIDGTYELDKKNIDDEILKEIYQNLVKEVKKTIQ